MRHIILYMLYATVVTSCFMRNTDYAKTTSTATHMLVDMTDRKQLWPTTDPVLELFQCTQSPNGQCSFRVSVITDKQLNPSFSCQLADDAETASENTEGDPQFRNRSITDFYAEVHKCLQNLYRQFDTTHSFAYSEVWAAVCAELLRLGTITADRKYLLVFSDLREKSTLFNSYRNNSYADIATIATKFEKFGCLPEDLSGIEVIIVYKPVTRAEDGAFNVMVSAYRQVLEKRRARVVVQASNEYYEP